MKTKTADLIGPALDWAVAKCIFGQRYGDNDLVLVARRQRCSSEWAQGGPIIEREKIAIDWDHDCWNAYVYGSAYGGYSSGPTALVAAMRNYVTSKLGDEVDVPEELL